MESNLQSNQILLFFGIAILIMVALALAVVVFSNRAQKRLLQQKMDTQALQMQHQQELLQHNLSVQEAERQRIAAQLHDDIGSKLGVLHLTFHRLRRTGAKNEDFAPLYEEINGLIANTLDTTRRISHELLPPTLEDFGLLEALTEFCEGIRKTGAVEIHFEHNLTRADLPNPNTELHLFRIVQELTNNSLKYANATLISIQLLKNTEQTSLRYHDNGDGFDQKNIQSKGLGLRNLENRARMVNGKLQVNTAPGKGFEMIVVF